MGSRIDIPSGPQDITLSWLTNALRSRGAINNANVTSFETKIIGEGAGFMGQLAKLSLTYDKPEPGAPSSLISKHPAAAIENRQVAMFFRFYEREVRFYDEIAETIDLRTPRCYYSAFDPATGDYILLLEDLAPAKVGDQLAGCTGQIAELAIRELANFHATWWEHPRLAELDWMPNIDAEWYTSAMEESYGEAWPAFLSVYGERMTPALKEIGERFGRTVKQLAHEFGKAPCTIAHADYRLDNLFFGGPDAPLAVIDWQISFRGRGVFDVAYFTSGTLPPDERKAKERDLLHMYHDILTERGVKDYSFEQCWEDYRRGILFCIIYAVIGIGGLDMANQRGLDLSTAIADRTMAAITDLNAGELLPS
jgi:hypothetical protein